MRITPRESILRKPSRTSRRSTVWSIQLPQVRGLATISPESSVIDIAMAMARASDEGLDAAGEVLLAGGKDVEDPYLWAAIKFLADRLPDADADAIAWTRLLRNRAAVATASKTALTAQALANTKREAEEAQMRLL